MTAMVQNAAMTDFEKTANNLQVALDIDEQLTWGELFRFIDFARESGVSATDQVGFEVAPESPYDEVNCSHVVKLWLYVEPTALPTVPADASSIST